MFSYLFIKVDLSLELASKTWISSKKISRVEVIVNPIEDIFLVGMDIFCGCVHLYTTRPPAY